MELIWYCLTQYIAVITDINNIWTILTNKNDTTALLYSHRVGIPVVYKFVIYFTCQFLIIKENTHSFDDVRKYKIQNVQTCCCRFVYISKTSIALLKKSVVIFLKTTYLLVFCKLLLYTGIIALPTRRVVLIILTS